MITIDGSRGEGGGQMLRTALSLSLVTGKPFRMENLRANRARPGLMRQHLTAVLAAAEVGQAAVEGAEIGATHLVFEPGEVISSHARGRPFRFSVGTAGSTILVFQTVFPALAMAEGPSEFVLEGGTHNMGAPPFEFTARSWLPLMHQLGPTVDFTLEQPGFYPAGGGQILGRIRPGASRRFEGKLELMERGALTKHKAYAWVAHLPRRIAEEELLTVSEMMGMDQDALEVLDGRRSRGPGNMVMIELGYENVCAIFSQVGKKGVPAARVAADCVAEAQAYLSSDAPVGPHLADQLLMPMALADGGIFRTSELTQHTKTQGEIIKLFYDVEITCKPTDARSELDTSWTIEVIC